MDDKLAEETFCPSSPSEWRHWLEGNHKTKKCIWLIYFKKATMKPILSWSEAVDQALCYGWIDSVKKSIDHERYMQRFSPRKPKSNWSKINKEKINFLTQHQLMTKSGQDAVDIAKQNGMWEKSV